MEELLSHRQSLVKIFSLYKEHNSLPITINYKVYDKIKPFIKDSSIWEIKELPDWFMKEIYHYTCTVNKLGKIINSDNEIIKVYVSGDHGVNPEYHRRYEYALRNMYMKQLENIQPCSKILLIKRRKYIRSKIHEIPPITEAERQLFESEKDICEVILSGDIRLAITNLIIYPEYIDNLKENLDILNQLYNKLIDFRFPSDIPKIPMYDYYILQKTVFEACIPDWFYSNFETVSTSKNAFDFLIRNSHFDIQNENYFKQHKDDSALYMHNEKYKEISYDIILIHKQHFIQSTPTSRDHILSSIIEDSIRKDEEIKELKSHIAKLDEMLTKLLMSPSHV